MTNIQVEEDEVTEVELDELIRDLEGEIDDGDDAPKKPSFWENLCRSWHKPKPACPHVMRFQKLAGIVVPDKYPAALILPDGQKVMFKELPSWKDVIRFKIAGLTYETYE